MEGSLLTDRTDTKDAFAWTDLNGGLFKPDLQLDILGDHLFEPGHQEAITDTSSESQGVSPQPDENALQETTEDIGWLDRTTGRDVVYRPPLRSWEVYRNQDHKEPSSAYLSESGGKGFDAVLAQQQSRGQKAGRVVRSDVFLQALVRLGLGWESAFFRYNHETSRFERTLDDIRVAGVSLPVFNQTVDEIQQCGTDMQRVRGFVRTPAKISALSTFASTVSVVLYTLELQLAANAHQAVSLLQIKALFRRGGEMVGALANMMDALGKASSDAQVMSVVMGRALYLSQRLGWIERLMREIAVRVIRPWLGYMEGWVGLRAETSVLNELISRGTGFAALEQQTDTKSAAANATPEYRYQPKQMPAFVPADQAQLIFESGKSLRFLKRSHPHHPLARSTAPKLRIADSWSDIERVQTKAYEYEASLRAEILKYNRGEREAVESEAAPETMHDASDTYDVFDMEDEQHTTGLLQPSSENDHLRQLGQLTSGMAVADAEFGPELTSSLYLSLAPMLASQALLIDFSCLHVLFKEHEIRRHLTLQWRFQLLGDGFFTSRLSSALFDPDMESSERKAGVLPGVHTGLRLGSRDTWPPASSELRLALIGILNESHGPTHDKSSSHGKEKELPGGLSFAIRELPEEEIAKCKDPNAIQALDFLRLHYKPPAALEIIITKQSLDKYDRLFKHLLRLLRMVSVVKNAVRDSTARSSLSGDARNIFQRFRIDAHHFIMTVSDYCFHVGVGSTWRRFQETLSRIEECLDRADIDGTIDAAQSVPRLRDHHDAVLDEMLLALFLSKRHAQAAKVLDSIFDIILSFAPISRLDGDRGVRHGREDTVRELYRVFRKQTAAFVEYLRVIPVRGMLDHLLVRLDMNGYY